MKRLLALLGGLGLLLLPSLGWAAPTETSATFTTLINVPEHLEVQLVYCDGGDLVAGVDTPTGGEDCESGDWSPPVDARRFQTMTLYVDNHLEATDIEVNLWDCLSPIQPGAWTPGDGDPTVTTAGIAYPQCAELSTTVTLDGLDAGIKKFSLSERKFNFLILEITTCTNDNCQFTATLVLGP